MARKSKEQIEKEQHSKRVAKHMKEHYKQIKFNLHTERQKDIIEHLEQQENKQQYITSLIKQDMNNNKSND